MAQFKIVLTEQDEESGSPPREIVVTDFEIRPLGFEALSEARPSQKITIPLDLRNARVMCNGLPELAPDNVGHVKATLESRFTSKAIGLCRGGWLPSALGLRDNTVILVDRNIVTEIVGRFENGMMRSEFEPDFIDLFLDQPITINPLLYALEGNTRKSPTPEVVRNQLLEVSQKLQRALPSAKLLGANGHGLKGVLGVIQDTQSGMVRKQRFLERLAPRLAAPVGRKTKHAMWEKVLSTASELAIPHNSLVVLAALSTVMVSGKPSPARRLLKFKPDYSGDDAYNALADLRSLEILAQLFAMFPDLDIQLCTADRDLALFWVGLQASQFRRTSEGTQMAFSPVRELLPDLTETQWRSIGGSDDLP